MPEVQLNIKFESIFFFYFAIESNWSTFPVQRPKCDYNWLFRIPSKWNLSFDLFEQLILLRNGSDKHLFLGCCQVNYKMHAQYVSKYIEIRALSWSEFAWYLKSQFYNILSEIHYFNHEYIKCHWLCWYYDRKQNKLNKPGLFDVLCWRFNRYNRVFQSTLPWCIVSLFARCNCGLSSV